MRDSYLVFIFVTSIIYETSCVDQRGYVLTFFLTRRINTYMNETQIYATIQYLEFNLVKFIEEHERHISDEDVVSNMYDRAYALLYDLETTMIHHAQHEKIIADLLDQKRNR